MDTNKMRDISREQFEQRYPVPEGCCWNVEQGRYVLFHLKLCTVAKYERFVENWVCWQASRDVVVVELPPKISAHNTTEGGFIRPEAEHYDEAIEDCREAIEAQGLKVEVKP
ncbi:hypothetical protein NPS53_07395 [Pseudomonas putida]|uniref:hypothetical protein n=1 Tax=Pseudomonas putida TaxID=303 RepID=UPI002363564D|nr:hypothetical protein [Pseudomonas putida]MDD2139394.1 hypothetical protein [Pseudomonas putida]HDS1723406.1 hypothetical protein [Pseudomonas putida]